MKGLYIERAESILEIYETLSRARGLIDHVDLLKIEKLGIFVWAESKEEADKKAHCITGHIQYIHPSTVCPVWIKGWRAVLWLSQEGHRDLEWR